MDPAARKKLHNAIMTILGLALAALLGWLAGCRMTWTPNRAQLEFGFPNHGIDVTFHAHPASQPAPEPSP